MAGLHNMLLSWGSTGPYYTASVANTTINEGDALAIVVQGENMDSNTTLYWEVVTVDGTLDSDDFDPTSGALTGTFTKVKNTNQQAFILRISRNYITPPEGTDSFYVRFRKTNSSGIVVATTPTVYINDTASTDSPQGQVQYTTPGTYTFIAPQTTTYAVVCVGGGGGGAIGDGPDGGGGGALSYVNGMSLTAGQSYTVVVGAGGAGGVGVAANGMIGNSTNNFANGGIAGGNSYFINATACFAGGGLPGNTATNGRGAGGTGVVSAALGTSRATFAGGGGGYGTASDTFVSGAGYLELNQFGEFLPDAGAGGGAAGYAGVGGSGPANTATANCSAGSAGSGGGGGGGTANPDGGSAGGGGVGLQGQGTDGVFYNWYESNIFWNSICVGGGGGSGGSDGPWADSTGGAGGLYGGGAGGHEYQAWMDDTIGGTYIGFSGGTGANGAVRIIWGTGRAYPSTNTADV